MCGITGLIATANQVDDRGIAAVRRMSLALTHRGPDDHGEHVAGPVAMALRRLSILDIAGGRQPLFNEDDTIAVVANGEIYNHASLRRDLEARGHRFRSRSDCETIVHAYEEYGDACVERLRGMFAFAVHDMRRRRVVLARDRLGEKPLYLADAPVGLVFASELRGLLTSGLVPTTFDASSLHTFLHVGFVPEPDTAIAGVRKLPAGSMLTLDLDRRRRDLRRYWSFGDVAPGLASVESVGAALDEVASFITDADVPVGVALSGGVDSGAITVLSAAHSRHRLHAFTVGYDEIGDCDETEDARRLARYVGVEFHPLRLTTAEVVESFPETIWHKDDPNTDIAGPAYLTIMRAARRDGVPVLLFGQGADELFWGYPWLVEAARRSRAMREGVGRILGTWWSLTRSRRVRHEQLARRLVRWGRQIAADAGNLAADLTAPSDTLRFFDTLPGYRRTRAEARGFFNPGFLRQVDPARLTQFLDRPEITAAPPEAALLQLICDTYLRENGLGQVDRLSMAASVEARAPLVDYRLAELAYAHQLASGPEIMVDKQLLRRATSRVCPPWLVERPKRGFTPPVAAWSAAIYRRYAPFVEGGLLVERDILSAAAGRRVAEAVRDCRNLPPLYHDTVALEIWCRQIVAGAPLPA